jgi:hypothetical protein
LPFLSLVLLGTVPETDVCRELVLLGTVPETDVCRELVLASPGFLMLSNATSSDTTQNT